MPKRYEVQTRFEYGWENCWMETNDEGIQELVTYPNLAEAEVDLAEFLKDTKLAGMGYLAEDYRIVESLTEVCV